MSKSRRKFLTEVFLKPGENRMNEGKMIRAITKSGDVILIDPSDLDTDEKTKRANNKELFDWINSN